MEKSMRGQKPTKSEIMAFLRKNVIDVATARNELIGLGYPDKYVQWYLQLG
jgi:hypothetical protein